ncbi:hypothetical protein F6U93_11510 [Tamlana haliotis]|uniref:Uncharacterized protein n=1 Tax=Pseudotamlana haliotis TaxID=2614804 RepID=A0A6N6MDU6_9FLAO|nr:hypothetical protein F6U93_11510 [Tamlana haliotis]
MYCHSEGGTTEESHHQHNDSSLCLNDKHVWALRFLEGYCFVIQKEVRLKDLINSIKDSSLRSE